MLPKVTQLTGDRAGIGGRLAPALGLLNHHTTVSQYTATEDYFVVSSHNRSPSVVPQISLHMFSEVNSWTLPPELLIQ